ncbi:MAG TPA: EAL domain-containing protein [Acidimicrobiia bacterium]|jgi:diguanylate cyclase (GGDEF)-like protein|nr:EAL domain-containing protein [Acidimicrobiia bacterium]
MSERAARWLTPDQRTGLLGSALIAFAIAMFVTVVPGLPSVHEHTHLPWWAFLVAFAVTEATGFDLEVKGQSHGFTLNYVPLVVGLFYVGPLGLICAYLIGCTTTLVLRHRQRIDKLLCNVGVAAAEATVAIILFRSLVGGATIVQPMSWLSALVAVGCAGAVSSIAIPVVIRWYGEEPQIGTIMVAGAVTVTCNTSIALAAALLVRASIAATVLIAIPVAMIAVAYRSYTSLWKRYANLQLFYDFTRAIGGSQRAESVLESILEQARELLRADVAELTLESPDPDGPVFALRAQGDMPFETSVPAHLLPSEWMRGRVIGEGKTVLVPRSTKQADEQEHLDWLCVRDCIVAPLHGAKGVVGTLTVGDRLGETSTFDAQDARLLETLANHSSVALENGRLVDRLSREVSEREHQAMHDALTGLPNRANLFERLEEALEERSSNEAVAVLLMDLDRFKDINDALGHDTGDEVLRLVARRVRAALDEHATVARLGGDEYSIVLPHIADADAAAAVAHEIRTRLSAPLPVAGMALEVGGSIGIALAPAHGTDAATLMKHADIAMYEAKRAQGVGVYEPESDDFSVRRLELAGALRRAIDDGELLVFYQPKARLSDGAIIGAEALVRWQHPEYGMLPPDEFISIAERTGLIGPLTHFVARRAIAQCRSWHAKGWDLNVAVNLSVVGLIDVELPEMIDGMLKVAGLDPSYLTMEITETSIMDTGRTVAAIDRLARLGIRLSIDDFGTGYSSLSYLQKLPVHEVKVDKSFVMSMSGNESDAAIVKSIIDLAHNLDLKVVAEGVENHDSWERLDRFGCDIAQGYYLSRPIPPDAFDEWLTAWPERRIELIGPQLASHSAIASRA